MIIHHLFHYSNMISMIINQTRILYIFVLCGARNL